MPASPRHALSINPYRALGLQRNPFILEEDPVLPAHLWMDRGWSVPPPRAKKLVQILGVKGAGKTSLLRYWQVQTGGPYCYYPPGWGRVKMPPVDAIAYWDEADRIPLPLLVSALISAARDCSTIVVGTHVNLSAAARLAGVNITTIQLRPFDGDMLIAWVRRRIEAVRLPGEPCRLHLAAAKAAKIAIAAGGSWRDAADELHVWAAQQAAKKVNERADLPNF